MIAAVFFCQPAGQLIAVLVAFAATAGFRSHIAGIVDAPSCSVFAVDSAGIACARSVDRAWRLLAGLGCVPAAVAMVFRLTIPESVGNSLIPKELQIGAQPDKLLRSIIFWTSRTTATKVCTPKSTLLHTTNLTT